MVVGLVGSPKEPIPPIQVPELGVVVTSTLAISLLQIAYGPPGVTAAGVLMASSVISMALVQGPSSSGSKVSHVRSMVVPTSDGSGV